MLISGMVEGGGRINIPVYTIYGSNLTGIKLGRTTVTPRKNTFSIIVSQSHLGVMAFLFVSNGGSRDIKLVVQLRLGVIHPSV